MGPSTPWFVLFISSEDAVKMPVPDSLTLVPRHYLFVTWAGMPPHLGEVLPPNLFFFLGLREFGHGVNFFFLCFAMEELQASFCLRTHLRLQTLGRFLFLNESFFSVIPCVVLFQFGFMPAALSFNSFPFDVESCAQICKSKIPFLVPLSPHSLPFCIIIALSDLALIRGYVGPVES